MSFIHPGPKSRKHSSISDYFNPNNKEIKNEPFLNNDNTNITPNLNYRKIFVIFLTLNASLGSFYIGWSFGVLDTIQANLVEIFQWNKSQKKLYLSLLSSAIPIGAAFGSIMAGKITLLIGRRLSFILFDILSIIGIAFTLILNEYSMLIGRFISGISSGAFGVVISIYVNEYVPYEVSGLCGAIYEFFYCFGVFCSYLFGLNLPPVKDVENQWWRVMISFPGILTFLNMTFLLLIFRHDTPKYLYINKRDQQMCVESLSTIYNDESGVRSMTKDYEDLSLIQESEVPFKDLFGKKYRYRLFIVVVIMVAQQSCGIDALLMYSNEIFMKDIKDKSLATIYTNIIGLTQVISALVAIFIIEKLGRRLLLITGLIFITLTLYSISLFYSDIIKYTSPVIPLFIFFVFCNGMSLSPLSYIYAPDLLPDTGVSFGMMCNYFTSFAVAQTFLFLEDSSIGISGTIFIYATTSLFALVVSIICTKETRGLSASEIDELFVRK
jgi:MFS family permease